MLTPEQQAEHIRHDQLMIRQQVEATGCCPQEVSASMAGAIRTAAGDGMSDEIKEQCATIFRMALGLKG